VIFLLVAVLFIVIFNLFDFLLVTYFTGLSTFRFYQAGYFVGLSYGVSVELFVVLFSIFVVFEVGVYFVFYHYLNLTLTIQHCFTLIQLLLFQPTWTENKSIFQPIKQINQIICPCNIPDQLIYFT